jgi:MYXO-CTERM domain-containing protein
VNWGTDLNFGQQYAVVASYEYDTGFARLWVNPVGSGSPSVQATASPSPSTPISELGLRQAFSASIPNTQILVGRVSMAETFNEALAGILPEPTSGGLALMGLLGAAMGRRRRR